MASASNPAGSNATLRILLFYAAAIALGVLNGFYGTDLTIRAGDFLSSVFIRLFKFISIPIIAVSLISTLAQLGESRESGQIFRRTIFYTLFTTIIAATVAAALFLLYAPANVSLPTEAGNVPKVVEHSYFEYVQSVIPDNFLSPFLSANVISVLLVSGAIGLALSHLEKDSRPKEVLTSRGRSRSSSSSFPGSSKSFPSGSSASSRCSAATCRRAFPWAVSGPTSRRSSRRTSCRSS